VPRFDVSIFRELASRYSLDTLQLAPAMLHALAFAPENIDLGSLKYVTSGTAPLPIATRDAFEQRYGVPVLQAYGSTEGAVTARERFDDVKVGRRGPGSVGRVDKDTPVRIVDPLGNDVPVGHDGEIIGRPDLSRSSRYLDAGGSTSLPLDSDGWYHTGDIGHFDEHGILYITGRLKEVFVVGGFNVFPVEIEDALRESPLVQDAVVVAMTDDRLGEVPVAGIVWQDGDRADLAFESATAQLTAELRQGLAPYKVPRSWFTLKTVPLNGNGKLDRHEAAKIAASILEMEAAL
jgi:acyl-CoA synthetase (AMP-forming)/AMP-acid ligase II